MAFQELSKFPFISDANTLIAWLSYADLNSTDSCRPHSTFHRQCKIADILICTLYIYSNTGIFLFWANISAGCCYWINHFEHSQMNLANDIAEFIAPSTALLKSWIMQHIPLTYTVALLHFLFEWICHAELAIWKLHFEVTKISFFVVLQMRTTIHYKNSISRSVNNCPTVSTHRLWRNMKWLDVVQKRRFPNKLGTCNCGLLCWK